MRRRIIGLIAFASATLSCSLLVSTDGLVDEQRDADAQPSGDAQPSEDALPSTRCIGHDDCPSGGICEAGRCRRAKSCLELHQSRPTLGDASYAIDPLQDGSSAPITAYCDMSTSNGGWTLVFVGVTPCPATASTSADDENGDRQRRPRGARDC